MANLECYLKNKKIKAKTKDRLQIEANIKHLTFIKILFQFGDTFLYVHKTTGVCIVFCKGGITVNTLPVKTTTSTTDLHCHYRPSAIKSWI